MHAFATFASQGTPQAVHWMAGSLGWHENTLLVAQQSCPGAHPPWSVGSQLAHWPLGARLVAHAPEPPSLRAQRASAPDTPAPSHATQALPSHSGAVGSVQSSSVRHSTHAPGAPTQNGAPPSGSHDVPVPQRQPRFVHVFARSPSHGTLQAVHSRAGAVASHAGVPLDSQHSSVSAHPLPSAGSHAAHSPFFEPVVAHAAAPPGFAAQRASAAAAESPPASHATHFWFTQSGFVGSPQSVSATQATQRPLEVSHTAFAPRLAQWAFVVHG